MADGTITFDTSIDTKGVSDATSLIKRSFAKVGDSVRNAFGMKNNKALIEKLTQSAKKATYEYEKQAEKVAELSRKLDELNAKKAEYEAKGIDENKIYAETDRGAELTAKADRLQSAYTQARLNAKKAGEDAQNGVKGAVKLQNEWNDKAEKLKKKYEAILAVIEQEENQYNVDVGNKVANDNAIIKTSSELNDANMKLEQMKFKAEEAGNKLNSAMDAQKPQVFQKAMGGVASSIKQATNKIKGLVKRVLIFSVITKALNKIKQLVTTLTQSDPQITKSFARIKGNLLTAFQPIWEYILPALRQAFVIIEQITAKLAKISATIFGKNTTDMAKNAKALYETANAEKAVGEEAEKASKSLAGFDELNQLGSDDKSSDSNSTSEPDFSGFEDPDYGKLDETSARIASYGLMIAGTALLLIGIITVNVSMMLAGLALIIGGVEIGEATNFGDTPMWVKQIITWGFLIAGTVLIAVGIIKADFAMALAGVALLGVGMYYGTASGAFSMDGAPLWVKEVVTWGLMITGTAILLVGVVTANVKMIVAGLALLVVGGVYGSESGAFSSMPEWVSQVLTWGLAILGVGLLLVGIITGNAGLIVAGLVSLGAGIAVGANNKNQVVETINTLKEVFEGFKKRVKQVYDDIGTYTKEFVNDIISRIENLINWVISGINWFIGKINSLIASTPQWVKNATNIGDFQLATYPTVRLPRLATGTVIPANYGEFGAILGDNKQETEVVSPLSTIKQALIEAIAESGNSNINSINLYLSNRNISEGVIEYINGKSRQLNVNVIKGV